MRPLTTLLALALLFASIGCISPFGNMFGWERSEPYVSGPYDNVSRLDASDIDILTGPAWTGTLTYRDEPSSVHVTIPSTLAVRRIAPIDGFPTWEFRFGYPTDPRADTVQTVDLLASYLGGEWVRFRRTLPEGGMEFIIETPGTDNGRPALLRRVHRVTPTTYSRQDLVTYDGESKEFQRRLYKWTR